MNEQVQELLDHCAAMNTIARELNGIGDFELITEVNALEYQIHEVQKRVEAMEST